MGWITVELQPDGVSLALSSGSVSLNMSLTGDEVEELLDELRALQGAPAAQSSGE